MSDITNVVSQADAEHLIAFIALVALVSVPLTFYLLSYLIKRPSDSEPESDEDSMKSKEVAIVTVLVQPIVDLTAQLASRNEIDKEANRLHALSIDLHKEQIEAQRAGMAAMSANTIKTVREVANAAGSKLQGQASLIQVLSNQQQELIATSRSLTEKIGDLASQIEVQAKAMPTKADLDALLLGIDAKLIEIHNRYSKPPEASETPEPPPAETEPEAAEKPAQAGIVTPVN